MARITTGDYAMTMIAETTTQVQELSIGTVYRQSLQDVYRHAQEVLPHLLHSRLAKALAIVEAGGVTIHPNGIASVTSQGCPGKHYVVAKVCQCPDVTKAPSAMCKHLLGVMLQRRATAVAAQRIANGCEPITMEHGVTPGAVEVIAPTEPQTPVAPLPEAPASANAFIVISGHKVQVTLRDHDEGKLMARMAAVLAQYPAA
jgi:hypothetical protein